ncbi:MAG: alpha/beta hydrolase fold domain-containing protein [Chlorobi bacterium]|nr:alpha/beta hydrolase fold domain-containing protein [Chlorobiota bacterium]
MIKTGILKFSGFIILIYLSVSCQKSKDNDDKNETGLFTKTIVSDGMTRRYAVYIPKDLGNASCPLIFELHGGGIYIEDMTGESGYKSPYKLWMRIADREKFIVVYPEGLNGVYGKPTWNDCRANSKVSSDADDVLFISTLIGKLSQEYKIDPSRIYVSGTSNGGLMALRLAVELSDKIAAVAAIAAAMPDSSECGSPVLPVSVLFMNGTDDNHLPYNGGTLSNPPNPDNGTVYSTETSVKIWTTFDQTDTVPLVYDFPDLDPDDGGIVTRYIYSGGRQGTEVVLYKVNGGGHSAPSIKEQYSALFEQYYNKQNHDIEMTTEVWNFFKDKRRN